MGLLRGELGILEWFCQGVGGTRKLNVCRGREGVLGPLIFHTPGPSLAFPPGARKCFEHEAQDQAGKLSSP